jgi:hypothetical protein
MILALRQSHDRLPCRHRPRASRKKAQTAQEQADDSCPFGKTERVLVTTCSYFFAASRSFTLRMTSNASAT